MAKTFLPVPCHGIVTKADHLRRFFYAKKIKNIRLMRLRLKMQIKR
jgi:hypothetical protein